jgi:predicted small secreted protein
MQGWAAPKLRRHFITGGCSMLRIGKLMLTVLVCLCALSACNTIEGVGKDVKKAGEAIERAGK